MDFLVVFVVTTALVFLLRGAIKKAPLAFYLLAVVVVVLFFVGVSMGYKGAFWRVMFLLVQRCMVALSLFTIVMYIGAFAKESKVGLWLRPIRAELSIVAWILCMGHMCMYASQYLEPVLLGTTNANVLASLVMAIVLFVLLLVLGVTSFAFVKKRMSAPLWKKIQWFAYPFFICVYVHILLMLLPAALHGGLQAQLSVGIYSVVFVGYLVARSTRALRDRKTAAGDALRVK